MQIGILERRPEARIGFFHETALDYYLAQSFRELWRGVSAQQNVGDAVPPTATATEILAGVLDSADDLIHAVLPANLPLAARCYGSRSMRSSGIKQELIATSITFLESGDTSRQEAALRALGALDEADATRALFNWLPLLLPQLVSVAQDVLVRLAPTGAFDEVLCTCGRRRNATPSCDALRGKDTPGRSHPTGYQHRGQRRRVDCRERG